MCYVCHRPGELLGLLAGNVVEGPWGTLAWKWHSVREEPPYPRISHLICRERGGRTKTHRPTAGLTRTLTMGDACVPSVVHSHRHTEQNIIFYVWFLNMAWKRIMLEMIRANYGFRTRGALDLFRGAKHMTVFIHTAHRFARIKTLMFQLEGSVHQNY